MIPQNGTVTFSINELSTSVKKSQKDVLIYFCLSFQVLTGIVTRQKYEAMQSIHLPLVYVKNEKKLLEGGGPIQQEQLNIYLNSQSSNNFMSWFMI